MKIGLLFVLFCFVFFAVKGKVLGLLFKDVKKPSKAAHQYALESKKIYTFLI